LRTKQQIVPLRYPQTPRNSRFERYTVFIGGVTVAGVVDACWDVLGPGGRLVANAVTLEG
jgi:precorrin-6Y C5,15-methyltransferase (decarboxylating)